MVFLYFNMHLVNNINIYVMYILCLIKSNDVVNMAVFIFSRDYFGRYAR